MSIVQKISNPVFANSENTKIDCLVKFDTVELEIPFTADKHDVEIHCRAIYDALMAGEYGPIGAYVPPPEPVIPTQAGPTVVA